MKRLFSILIFSLLASAALANDGLKTELKVIQQRPTLLINGQPHHGIFCSVRSPYMQNFIDAGFDIFDTHPATPHGWIGDGQYDYTATDAYIDAYLKQKPDAKLIILFWFGYPRNFWWAMDNKAHQSVPKVRDKGRKMPSYASHKWRKEAGEALYRAIAHCEEKYGENIVAYVPGGGSCGEWFQWHTFTEDADRFTKGYEMGDYSQPMLKAYQQFVRKKYGTLKTVSRAYHQTINSWDALQLPTPEHRLNAQLGHLRDIRQEQALLDYYEIFNLQVAETLVGFAERAKAACHRNKVIMVFYGYHWLEQPNGGVTLARSGHVHLDKVLSSPDVDYVVGPYHYSFRQLEGVMSGQGLPAAALLRGKQYVQEIDCSTCLKPSWPCEDHHVPQTPEASGMIFKRDLSKTLMEGASCWFMDLFQSMYDSPEVIDEIKAVLEAGKQHYFQSGKDDRQVAVVLPSRDAFYFRENDPLRALLLPQFKQFELERMGLSYDDILLENLKYLTPQETAQYKFWIFPSAVHLDDAQRALIQKHCMRNDNHVLWVYAPGILSEKGLDLKSLQSLTGFQCGVDMTPGELAIRVVPGDHPFTAYRQSPLVYGTYGETSPDLIKYHSSLRHTPGSETGYSVTPRLFITSADQILGHILDLPDLPGGLGVKQMKNWTSVLSTAPMVHRWLLRNIAREAGCHVYTDFPGQTYHSQNYVGFFAHDSGPCTFKLPFKAKVTELFTGKAISLGDSEITLDLKVNQAVLLHYEALQ